MVVTIFLIASLLLPVIYSYLIYPVILYFLPTKPYNYTPFLIEENQKVALVIPVHNEERILSEKLDSIFQSTFPIQKLEIFLLLDDCTDGSLAIAQSYQKKGITIHILSFDSRMGKPKLLNSIMQKLDKTIYPITLLSDANVVFLPNTIENLLRPFSQNIIGLVDSRLATCADFNIHETTYLKYELYVKMLESQKLGAMQGPFGGCYAIRTNLYIPIPENFLVDDFFIGSNVLLQDYRSVLAADACVVEHYKSDWSSEFRRKRRISGGNFQNLFYLLPLFIQKRNYSIFLCFVSHKMLRWLSPYLLICTGLSTLFALYRTNTLLYAAIITGLLYILDVCFSLLFRTRSTAMRILYFVWMNIATALGGWDYIRGIRSNIWQRTER